MKESNAQIVENKIKMTNQQNINKFVTYEGEIVKLAEDVDSFKKQQSLIKNWMNLLQAQLNDLERERFEEEAGDPSGLRGG